MNILWICNQIAWEKQDEDFMKGAPVRCVEVFFLMIFVVEAIVNFIATATVETARIFAFDKGALDA